MRGAGDDIRGDGEAVEEVSVPVSEHHAVPVPEGVVVALPMVDVSVQRIPSSSMEFRPKTSQQES
jgi:hypothetical protein